MIILLMLVVTAVVGALPIWLAAKIIGAGNATFSGAIMAMVVSVLGMGAALLTIPIIGLWALLLALVVYLLAFKSILQTSFFGAIVLVIIAGAISAAISHVFGGGSPIH